MARLVNRLRFWVLRIAAGALIALALLVGVARLLLPEAARFAEDVRRAALEASGFHIDFELLSAGVSLYGPELRLDGVQVRWPTGETAFRADQIAVALDVGRLITQRRIAPSLLHVEGALLDAAVAEDGTVLLQGHPWSDYLRDQPPVADIPAFTITLEGIALRFEDRKRGIQPLAAELRQLSADIDADAIELQADILPERGYGRALEIAGRVPLLLFSAPGDLSADERWRLRVLAEDFRLDPWLRLAEFLTTPVIDSEGTARAEVEFAGLQAVAMELVADIDRLALNQPDGPPAVYDSVAGTVNWERTADGWVSNGSGIRLERAGRRWPETDYAVLFRNLADGGVRLETDVGFARIDDLMPGLVAFAGEQLAARGIAGMAVGDVWDAGLQLTLQDERVLDYAVQAGFADLGYADPAAGIDVAGLGGELSADMTGGSLQLATRDAHLGWDQLFRERLPVSTLDGLAVWRARDDGFRLLANDLRVTTPDGRATASLELASDNAFANPVIDLVAEASMEDATAALKYLPVTLPAKVLDWLDGAILAGSSPGTEFRLRGPLREFPFRDDQGEFLIDIGFTGGMLRYGPDWPVLENASGHLIFANESMYSVENTATMAGIEWRNIDARIDDLRDAVIRIEGGGPAGVANILDFLQRSPVGTQLGSVFADVGATGQGEARLALTLPVRELSGWQLDGSVDVRNASVSLAGIGPRITGIAGRVTIDDRYVTAPELQGALLGRPVTMTIEANRAGDANFSHRVSLNGNLPYADIERELGLPALGKLDGSAEIKAAAMFPAFRADGQPFRLLIHSDLAGISSTFPHPLGKAAPGAEDFDAEILFPVAGLIDVRMHLERGLHAALDVRKQDGRWRVTGGAARFGGAAAGERGSDGIIVDGFVDRVSVTEWTRAFAADDGDAAGWSEGRERWQDLFDRVALSVADLEALDYRFEDTDVRALFGDTAWEIELAGPWVQGSLTVPFAFDSSGVVEADMERLLLIEPLPAPGDAAGEYTSTPANMPGIRGVVREFALGNLQLGNLEGEVRSTGEGLVAERLDLRAPYYEGIVSGDWLVVGSAQRSRMHIELRSTDVATTLQRFGFAPLLSAESFEVIADLIWEGGPGMAVLEASTGEVALRARNGSVNDVDAGGGRLLGLLSVASLPRRLALDFTDLTEDKLPFSTIDGNFRIDFGDAWTCNLGLEGDVADMVLVGRTGLNAEDYDQVAVVRPQLSNLMPVPAAFLGGPTVGVAALLVSQIFKKPLSGIGESYYTVRGPWENTEILRVQRTELDTTAYADCEQQLPELSPEELAAMQELIAPLPGAPAPAAEQPPQPEASTE